MFAPNWLHAPLGMFAAASILLACHASTSIGDFLCRPVRAFTYLTNGPLKGQMLQFYAVSTSFTRRLTDIRANSKFSSPDATADDVSSVTLSLHAPITSSSVT